MSARATRAVLYRRLSGQPSRRSSEAVSVGKIPHATRQDRPADLRRVGLPLVQPHRRGIVIPSLRRSLRASQPANHQQPCLQRLEPDIPRRPHDRRALGSPHAPLPHFRDERRKLPLPRVDEKECQQGTPPKENHPHDQAQRHRQSQLTPPTVAISGGVTPNQALPISPPPR